MYVLCVNIFLEANKDHYYNERYYFINIRYVKKTPLRIQKSSFRHQYNNINDVNYNVNIFRL